MVGTVALAILLSLSLAVIVVVTLIDDRIPYWLGGIGLVLSLIAAASYLARPITPNAAVGFAVGAIVLCSLPLCLWVWMGAFVWEPWIAVSGVGLILATWVITGGVRVRR